MMSPREPEKDVAEKKAKSEKATVEESETAETAVVRVLADQIFGASLARINKPERRPSPIVAFEAEEQRPVWQKWKICQSLNLEPLAQKVP